MAVIIISSYQLLAVPEVDFNTTKLTINQQIYTLEIAKSQDQRQKGLMFRTALGSKNGMIFIYSNSANHRIWMKNTLIKLTVLWVNEDGSVLGIKKPEPCQRDPCEIYGLNQPSKYIIELNHDVHGIKIGDKILGLNQL